VRIGRDGTVRLRVSCAQGEQSCRVRLSLRLGSRTIARKTLALGTGETRRVGLKLSRAARRTLQRRGRLRVTAVAVVRNQPGGEPVSERTSILVRAR
jgi:hypothetical protein